MKLTGWFGGHSLVRWQLRKWLHVINVTREIPTRPLTRGQDKGLLWFSGQKMDFCLSSHGRSLQAGLGVRPDHSNRNWHLASVGGSWGILLWLIDIRAPGWFPEGISLNVFVLGYYNFFMSKVEFHFEGKKKKTFDDASWHSWCKRSNKLFG